MSKEKLIARFALEHKTSKTAAQRSIEQTLQSMTSLLKTGENLRLVGFGTFIVRNRAARLSANPTTREEVQVPEKNQISFRASTKLKEAANLKKALDVSRKKRVSKEKATNATVTKVATQPNKPTNKLVAKSTKPTTKIKKATAHQLDDDHLYDSFPLPGFPSNMSLRLPKDPVPKAKKGSKLTLKPKKR